eukprot:GHVP01034100.1.p1 GENE.GHVP01034100.1~~GHVP01034100.1.p1  ORF type:complete len:271 (+),score=37.62 GHVP01034100.1:64-876(+)
MEFKQIMDQLNSACEDHFVIPQPNGIVQDELHQENSSEPDFKGIRWGKSPYYTHKDVTNPVPELRKKEEDVFNLVQEVLHSKENKYVVEKSCEELTWKADTAFYIKAENKKDFCRSWTVWLCNCVNREKIQTEDDPLGPPCLPGESCCSFTISWNLSLSLNEQQKLSQKLSTAFEYLNGWNPWKPRKPEEPQLTIFRPDAYPNYPDQNNRSCFPKWWWEFVPSSSESFSTGDSGSTSGKPEDRFTEIWQKGAKPEKYRKGPYVFRLQQRR